VSSPAPPSPALLSSPALLYGTAWKKERTASLVERALDLGFRGVDTACQPKHYDEPGVGAGVAACLARGLRREELYLQTKFTPLDGQDRRRLPYAADAPLREQIEQSCAASLRNLRVTHLDALLLHSPISPRPRLLEAWRCFESLVGAGHVRALGISNCYDADLLRSLCDAVSIPPSVVQNRFYADTGYDRLLRAVCRERGIRYQSFWTLTANPHVLAHAALVGIARRHAATPAQVFFRYLISIGITPLTGTTSEQHMRDDLSVMALTLSPDEGAEIARLLE